MKCNAFFFLRICKWDTVHFTHLMHHTQSQGFSQFLCLWFPLLCFNVFPLVSPLSSIVTIGKKKSFISLSHSPWGGGGHTDPCWETLMNYTWSYTAHLTNNWWNNDDNTWWNNLWTLHSTACTSSDWSCEFHIDFCSTYNMIKVPVNFK